MKRQMQGRQVGMNLFRYLLGIALVLGFGMPIHPQWPTTPDSSVFVGGGGVVSGGFHAISDGDGGAFAVWGAYRGAVQRISKYGERMWEGTKLYGLREDQLIMQGGIALGMNHSALLSYSDVTFTDPEYDAGYADIRVQKIDSAGARQWGQYGVKVSVDSSSKGQRVWLYSQVVSDGEGGAIVVWTDGREQEPWVDEPYDLFAQRVLADGSLAWQEGGIRLTPAGMERYASFVLVPSREHRFLVGPIDSLGRKAQLYTNAGIPLWENNGVTVPHALWQFTTGDTLGNFFWLCKEFPESPEVAILKLRKLNAEGMNQWGGGIQIKEGILNSYNLGGNQIFMIPDQQGGVLGLWSLAFPEEGKRIVEGQWVTQDGNCRFAEPLDVLNDPTLSGSTPELVFDEEDNILVNWLYPTGNDATLPDYIQVQKFDTTGQRLWDTHHIIARNEEIEWNKVTVPSDHGSFMVFFIDDSRQLKVQQMSAAGNVGEVITRIDDPSSGTTPLPNKFTLLPPYPNPFNHQVTLRYTLRQAGDFTITVYDLTGGKIWEHRIKNQAAGTHEVQWNGTTLDGRLVSSGLYLVTCQTGREISAERVLLLK